MPISPLLSRNATSFSPSSANRTGSPSAISSDERQAGTQYCRNKAPIGVPGPICVNNSFSDDVVMSSVLAVGVGIATQLQEAGQAGETGPTVRLGLLGRRSLARPGRNARATSRPHRLFRTARDAVAAGSPRR